MKSIKSPATVKLHRKNSLLEEEILKKINEK